MTHYSTADQYHGLSFHEFPDKGLFFARAAALLAFHLLNALLAISGAGLVLAFTVLSIALLPILLMIFASFVFVEVTIERFPHRNWVVFLLVILVLVAISGAIILLLGSNAFCYVLGGTLGLTVFGTLAQLFFLWLNAVTVNGLAFLDAELADFVVPRMPLQMYSATWKDEGNLPDIDMHKVWFAFTRWDEDNRIPNAFVTPAMWFAVFYFLVPKLLVGVLSAVSVWLSVAQPIVVLASSGRFPCVGAGTTFQDD
ncbi:hypothetical protein BBJ28_00007708, partial [Nothophytophthora sp. Chile5]